MTRKEKIPVDCNNCKNINLTELQQQASTKIFKDNHICNYYGKRLYHNTSLTMQNKIFPCLECQGDNYKNFILRKEA